MASILTDEKLINDLKDVNIDICTLYNRIKSASDNMHIIQNQSSISNLYVCVETILNRIPISYYDDYNHRIRNYCYIIFRKILTKGLNNKELKNRMFILLFRCVTHENELNAINVVKIIEYLFLINPIKDGILESFLQLVEDGYSRFRELALSFLQTPQSSTSPDGNPIPNHSFSIEYLSHQSSSLRAEKSDEITRREIPSVHDSILIMDSYLSFTQKILDMNPTLCPVYIDRIYNAFLCMLQTEIFSPTITTPKQYYHYVKESCYSIYFGCSLFTYFKRMTSELYDKMASSIIQFIVYYPKNDTSLRDIFIPIVSKIAKQYNSLVFLHALPLLLENGFLIDENTVSFSGYEAIGNIAVAHINDLSIFDLQYISLRFCEYIEKSTTSFSNIYQIIDLFMKLKPAFQRHATINCKSVLPIVYRIFITYVRKIEDIRQIAIFHSQTNEMKKKYQEYEYSNTRFIEFMKNEEEKPPLPEYDENGIRICSAIPESKIGDIVMRENKLSTIVLLQHLCKGIADIISFFTNAQSNRQEQPFLRTEILPQSFQQPSSFPQIQQIEFSLPFTEHFILLVYRYLIGIIECGELLTVDDTRTKEQIQKLIRCYAEVLTFLPNYVKRQVIAATIPKIYSAMKKNNFFFEFLVSIFSKPKQCPCIIVLIDFITNHLSDLETDTTKPPALLSLFKLFCNCLSIDLSNEIVFRSYFKRIVSECFRRMINAKNWAPYLDFIYQLFTLCTNVKFNEIPNDFPNIFKDIIPQLYHMEQVCGNSHIRERIIEIILHLPLPLSNQNFQSFFAKLIPFYITGLYGPETLQRSTLVYFESFFQKASTEPILHFLREEPFKSDFMTALNSIIHNSANSSLVMYAINLVGRLGGKARSIMKGQIDLPCISQHQPGYHITCSFSNTTSFDLSFDILLEEAVRLLHRNLIVESLEGTEKKLANTNHCKPSNILLVRSLRTQYKKLALKIIETCLIACCGSSTVSFDSSLVYSLDTILSTTDQAAMSYLFTNHDDDQERVVCLLLYGLLMSCCDVEVGEIAMESAKHILNYMMCLFINNTFVSADEEHQTAFIGSLSSYQSIVFQNAFGVVLTQLPLNVHFPKNCLSPLLLFDVITCLLDCDIPTISTKIIELSQYMLTIIQSSIVDDIEQRWLVMPSMEYFLAILLSHSKDVGWRSKSNICEVLLFWCEDLPDFILYRCSSSIVRYVFSYIREVPSDFIAHSMQITHRILHLLLVKGFNIDVDPFIQHKSIEFPQTVQWTTFKEKTDAKYDERIDDLAKVIIDTLLTFYGPAHIVARILMEDLTRVENAFQLVTALQIELKKRYEIQHVEQFPPQIQMSIYSTMEMSLRLHIFDINEECVKKIMLQATKPFDLTEENITMVRSIAFYDCILFLLRIIIIDTTEYYVPISNNDFFIANLLKMDVYAIVLKLVQVYILQRMESDMFTISSEISTLNSSIFHCVCLAFNCAAPTITDIIKPIIPYLRNLVPSSQSNSFFISTNMVKEMKDITRNITLGKDVVTYQLRHILLIYPSLSKDEQDIITGSVFDCLQDISNFFQSSKQTIKENVMIVICQHFEILSLATLTAQQFHYLYHFYHSFMLLFNQYCPFYSSDMILIKPLSQACTKNTNSYIEFLLSTSKETNIPSLAQPFVSTTFVFMLSNSTNDLSNSIIQQWSRFEEVANKCFDKIDYVHSITILNSIYRLLLCCVDSSSSFPFSQIHDFILKSWKAVLHLLDKRRDLLKSQKENVNVEAMTDWEHFQPSTYDEDNNEVVEVVITLVIKSLLHVFVKDPSLSNLLAISFDYPLVISLDRLRTFYYIELPKYLTAEQRADVLLDLMKLLRNPDLSDSKKGCVITNAIIPLVSTTFHNDSIDKEIAIPDSFLQDYTENYIQSIPTTDLSSSTSFLISLLQLNSLLMENCPKRVNPYRLILSTFASQLYQSSNDMLMAWSFYYQCQFFNSVEYNGQQTTVLFINSLHLYNNKSRSIIYKATALLSKSLLKLDEKNCKQIYSTVRKNMLLNDHISNQREHIWRLIIQNPEFFYPFREKICSHMLNGIRNVGIRNSNAYENRELVLNVLCYITYCYLREIKEHSKDMPENNSLIISSPTLEKNQDTVYKLFNTQLLHVACRLFLIIAMNPGEQMNYRRCHLLIKDILTLTPRTFFYLDDIDKLFPYLNQTLLKIPSEKTYLDENTLYSASMPLIATFRLTVYAFPYFPDFIEKNAKNLLDKITCLCPYLSSNLVFTSYIEILPVLFTAKQTTDVTKLLTSIKEVLLTKYRCDFNTITEKDYKKTTCVWRIFYLFSIIIDKTPSIISLFINDILTCGKEILSKLTYLFADPLAQRYIFSQDSIPTKLNQDYTYLDLPDVPTYNYSELVYSLLLIIKMVATHITFITADYRSAFIKFLCDFFKSITRAELLTTVLHYIREWVEGEVDIMNMKDLSDLLMYSHRIRSLSDSVVYIGIIEEYWQLIYSIYKRYYSQISKNEYTWLKRYLTSCTLAGLTLTIPSLRDKFKAICYPLLPVSLVGRLKVLFTEITRFSDNRSWLPLFVEILLTTPDWLDSISLSKVMKHFPSLRLQVNSTGTTKESLLQSLHLMKESSSNNNLNTVLNDLIQLSYADMRIAYSLWILFYPLAWKSLSVQQQVEVTTYLSKFLASDIHYDQRDLSMHLIWEEFDRDYKQWACSTSIPFTIQEQSRYGSIPITHDTQAILESLLHCDPLPHLAPSLLLYLSENFGCASYCSVYLERMMNENLSEKESAIVNSSLKKIYEILNEKDVSATFTRSLPYREFHNGITLERYNCLETAQLCYYEGLNNPAIFNDSSKLLLLQERWKECALNLKQWVSLFEYGKLNQDMLLVVDCYYKYNKWEQISRCSTNIVAYQDLSHFSSGLISDRSYLMRLLSEKTPPRRLAVNDIVIKHYRMQNYQPINEMDTVLHEITLQFDMNISLKFIANYKTMTDTAISLLLRSWSDCVMNEWDNLSKWEDLLIWRADICSRLKESSDKDIPIARLYPSFHYLILAKQAHKLGYQQIAAEYLNQINTDTNQYGNFECLMEKTRLVLDLKLHSPFFNQIDTVNINTLKPSQLSQFHYIKGMIAFNRGNKDDALGLWKLAFQKDEKNTEVLEKLASYYYDLMMKHKDKENAKLTLEYALQQLCLQSNVPEAMIRYLSAVDILCEEPNFHQFIRKSFNNIPGYLWLSYLSYLFSKPRKVIFDLAQPVICTLEKKYPEMVFYQLHTLCQILGYSSQTLYSKPTTLFNGTIGGSTIEKPISSHPDSSELLRLCMIYYHSLLSIPNKLISQLLIFIDILHSLPHDGYRELIASIDRLLRTIYSEIAVNGPSILSQPISSNLAQRIKQLCYISFNPNHMVPSTHAFILQYATSFTQDFADNIAVYSTDDNGSMHITSQPNPNYPSSLQVLFERLVTWKQVLLERIQNKEGQTLFNQFFTPPRIMSNCIEVPGQHYASPVFSQNMNLIQSIHQHIPILYKEPHQWRWIDFFDNNSHITRFYLEQINSVDLIIEERVMFFQIQLDRFFQKSNVIQMRHLQSSFPCYVNISPSLRLVRFDDQSIVLESLYHEYLGNQVEEKQFEYAMQLFVVNHPTSSLPDEYLQWSQSFTKQSMLQSIVPSSLLNHYIYDHFQSTADFYAFRSEFVRQYGYVQFIQNLFVSPNDNPDKMVFCLKNGKVMLLNTHPNYIQNHGEYGIVNRMAVPFRLTQNIREFITLNYEGAFELAVGSYAVTFKRNRDYLSAAVSLLEKENSLLLYQNEVYDKKRVLAASCVNANTIVNQGCLFAPNIDSKVIENTNDVDKAIRDAVRISTDPEELTHANPSFCAWF